MLTIKEEKRQGERNKPKNEWRWSSMEKIDMNCRKTVNIQAQCFYYVKRADCMSWAGKQTPFFQRQSGLRNGAVVRSLCSCRCSLGVNFHTWHNFQVEFVVGPSLCTKSFLQPFQFPPCRKKATFHVIITTYYNYYEGAIASFPCIYFSKIFFEFYFKALLCS